MALGNSIKTFIGIVAAMVVLSQGVRVYKPELIQARDWTPAPLVVMVERIPDDTHVDDLISEYATEYQIDPVLLKAVAKNENYRQWENNDAQSVKGALGVMQVMPNYHAGEGKTCGEFVKNWTDLVGKQNRRNNVRCGALVLATYLKQAQEKAAADAKREAIFLYNRDKKYVERVLATEKQIRQQSKEG